MSIAVTNSPCDRAQQALSSSTMWVLRQLKVDQDGKALVLTGQVNSFYQKQMAQEIVRAAVTGALLVNRVDVNS